VPVSDPFPAIGPGRVLAGRYSLVTPLAKGGMAEVWEGLDEVLSRAVAVKVLQAHLADDDVFVERFRREAVSAARLSSPAIVSTYDAGVDAGTAYIVMELVRGRTLRQLVSGSGALDPRLAVAIGTQIAEALVDAHRAGIVHRDIKPANVLVCDGDSGSPRVKVTDFGIAKAQAGGGIDLTRTGMVLGTPKYLSPEQIEGSPDVDVRSDLYSLGIVMFEMLTGTVPFEGDTEMATALAHLREPVPHVSARRPGIDPVLDGLVASLLAKSPAERPRDAVAARQALEAVSRRLGAPSRGGNGRTGGVTSGGPARKARPEPSSPGGPSGPPARPQGGPPRPGGLDSARRADERGPLRLGTRADTPLRPGGGSGRVGRRVGEGGSAPGGPLSPSTVPGGPSGPPRSGAARGGAREATAHARRRPARRAGGLAGTVVAAVALAGVVLVGLLLSGGGSRRRDPSVGSTSAVAIRAVSVYLDVSGPGDTLDHPGEVGDAYSGAPGAAWYTDHYASPDFGGLYQGEGLVIELGAARRLAALEVASHLDGWNASVFVSSHDIPSGQPVAEWGTPTASVVDAGPRVSLSLGGRRGRWVLLWLTRLGPEDQASISDLAVRAVG